MFARWGYLVYRARWLILAATIPFLALTVIAFKVGVSPNYNAQPPVESGRALNLINRELPQPVNSFDLIFSSTTLRVADPAFRAAMESALAF